ncbi:MAG: hypothetical protein OEY13_11885 [Gammaproteobacteria bacterium]|nr:hypothetical protein [Gammaproteobacteria bacterium]MDH4312026.1 hypothetical protein [Gammaproteobacteria bacterium]MDH5273765.1 hypothetical protein [Gammaproteobacteria bacterium]
MDNSPLESARPQLRLWVLGLGAVGFVAGLLGPVLLNPEANLGPLLGIFITGPGGAILGAILGLAVRWLGLPAARQWQVFGITAGVLAVGTLFLGLPEPRLRGTVIDAEIRNCKPPAQALERVMTYWEKQLTGTAARRGWQTDALRSAEADPGVVLELNIMRRIQVYEHRKPWNRGRLTTTGWQSVNAVKRYYARYAGGSCTAYPIGTRSLHYAVYPAPFPPPSSAGPKEVPPTSNVPLFLDLGALLPVPDELQPLIGKK